MRNFNHKNIVRIYGVAVDEQPLYIILELVTGELPLNSSLSAAALVARRIYRYADLLLRRVAEWWRWSSEELLK